MTFRQIQEVVGGSVSSVHAAYSKYHENEDWYTTIPNRGRKSLLTDSDHRFAVRLIKHGKCLTAADVQHRYFPHVSERRMREILAEEGLHGRRK